MKWLKRGLMFVGFFVLLILILEIVPVPKYERDNPWRKEANDGDTLVMAHAGGRLKNPGNTMRALTYSFDLGVDVLEIDIQMTKDDVLVLRHGENDTGNIKDRSNCDGLLYEMNYQEVYENCNFGYHFQNEDGEYPFRDLTFEEWVNEGVYLTTLEEVFTAFHGDILYNIEIKADGEAKRIEIADRLIGMIKDFDLEGHVLVATAFHDISEHIAINYPEIYLSTSETEARDMVLKALTYRSIFYQPTVYTALQLPVSFGFPVINELDLTGSRLLRFTHKHNMAMHYWTINDEAEMIRLIEAGADGIITDDPALLIRVIEELNNR
ncbi:MAG: glycerophosphodiester phosphodiesterase family protein [Candidatus Izemoplasmataceae bacterium]